jgi:hypothetical protein
VAQSSSPRWNGTAVAVARIGMGLAGLVAPTRLQQASLLPREPDARVKIWTRFWATRAIGLGVGYLTADTETRRHLIRVGFLVDALDTAFLLAMSARSDAPKRSLLWLASLTAWAAAGDVAEIRAGPKVTPGLRERIRSLR